MNEEYEPKFGKPGPSVKSSKIKNKGTRIHKIDDVKEKHCRRCNIETGTERFCHSESRIIKFLVGGKSLSGKINDRLTAWLCSDCNDVLSETPPKDSKKEILEHHALEWFIEIAKTWLI